MLYPKRIPVLLQLSQVECGAACLAMVLHGYGRAPRVSECRAAIGLGRDGVSVRNIQHAAQSYGLETTALRLPDLAALPLLPLPAIVHWNANHFVVLERVTARAIAVIDPASGRQKLAHERARVSVWRATCVAGEYSAMLPR